MYSGPVSFFWKKISKAGLEEKKIDKRMPTAPSVPRRSPIQVLTGPNVA